MRGLATYAAKRDFAATPEPAGGSVSTSIAPRFSFQKHDATRLHWDLRLEHDGVLLSWAVTRGPSLNPKDKRLAVRTEDHPVDYLTFEGTIPKGNYGAGTVMLWDIGWWQPFHDVDDGLRSGHLHFALLGQRTTGKWSLVRMKGTKAGDGGRENWLLIKEADEAVRPIDLTGVYNTSVATGRDLAGIGAGGSPRSLATDRKGTAPTFHPPQLAELQAAPPEGEQWWHEVKLDGYRTEVSLGKGGARIFTRNGFDWTDRFASLLPALEALPVDTALVDGEIVAGAGLERFGDVARAIDAGGPFVFYAFDLLYLNGHDLTSKPMSQRRAMLEKLFDAAPPRGFLRLSPVLHGNAAALFSQIADAGGEGLVSKLRSAPYRAGRSSAWIKSKVERRGAFVIVGWQQSRASGRTIASLLLGANEDGALVYRGKVGTGFDAETEAALERALTPLQRREPPLPVPRFRERITWVSPTLIAEVRYAEITRDGLLRQASFIALREDKAVIDVVTDDPATRRRIAGVGISSPDREVYPKPRITKLAVAEYYEAVADRLLSVARNRPLSLLRMPDGIEGEAFFQKHRGKGFPTPLREVAVPNAKGEVQDKMALTTPASVIAAVQMGTLEFHIEGVRTDKPLVPDRMIFDLDPDEGMAFSRVREAAVLIGDVLAEAGLPSWPMVSGGKGIHVTVPLRRQASTESVALFARLVATMLAERRPKAFTARMSKAERKGRIFVDWLRNDAGSTAVAPFSLRARPGAPVAVPVTWDELRQLRRANGFDMKEALNRNMAFAEALKPGSLSDRTVLRMSDMLEQL